jgi:phage/plasmid-associated DNA primase
VGFWRRLILIKFRREFSKVEADRGIGPRIAKEEAQGIVAWLVEGAKRAAARGHYAEPESHAEGLAEWKTGCDVVALFLAEYFDPEAKADLKAVPAASLYAAFRGWAAMNGHSKPPSSVKFGRRLVTLGVPKKHTMAGAAYGLKVIKEPGAVPISMTPWAS